MQRKVRVFLRCVYYKYISCIKRILGVNMCLKDNKPCCSNNYTLVCLKSDFIIYNYIIKLHNK